MRGRADQAEFLLTGKEDLLRTATLTGMSTSSRRELKPILGDAGRVILDFAGKNQLQKVTPPTECGLLRTRLPEASERQETSRPAPQDFELTAPVIDFTVAGGHTLQQAVTSGAAQITVVQARENSPSVDPASPPQKTIVTAGQFQAQFAATDGRNRLTSIHGAPNARIVNSTPGQSDRISTSDSVEAGFLPLGGIDSITQQGHVAYTDSQAADKRMQAWADAARYTPADQMLV